MANKQSQIYICFPVKKDRATLYNNQEAKNRLYSKFLHPAPEKRGNYYVVDEAQIFCTSPNDLDVFFFCCLYASCDENVYHIGNADRHNNKTDQMAMFIIISHNNAIRLCHLVDKSSKIKVTGQLSHITAEPQARTDARRCFKDNVTRSFWSAYVKEADLLLYRILSHPGSVPNKEKEMWWSHCKSWILVRCWLAIW